MYEYYRTAFHGGADEQAEGLYLNILNSKDSCDNVSGNTYYVSADGSDTCLGTNENSTGSVEALQNSLLNPGDMVLFKRGDIFRLLRGIQTVEGVSYGAYGEGNKPTFYGSARNYAGADWQSVGEHLNRLDFTLGEAGNIYFIKGNKIYSGCQKAELSQLNSDGDFFHDSKNKCIYVYSVTDIKKYDSIEIAHSMCAFTLKSNVTIQNLAVKYVGTFGMRGCEEGGINSVTINGCEIGWVGGTHHSGENVRFGNGIEFFMSAKDINVSNCYIYQAFDAGLTFQGAAADYKNISFKNNLIETCTFNVEFFSNIYDWEKDKVKKTGSYKNIEISHNIIRFAGCGWAMEEFQRDNWYAVSNILGWRILVPNTENFKVENNIFDCSLTNLVLWFWTEDADVHPGLTVSGNSFYQKNFTVDYRKYKWIQKGSVINFGKALNMNGNIQSAADQETFERSVSVFDSNPLNIKWIS